MSKPLGLSLTMSGGLPTLEVTRSNRTVDAIWEAVQMAMASGMTPRQFVAEAQEAWDQELSDERKDINRQFSHMLRAN